ncbi:MAG: helix-turn-helix domain-containing protein [Treponema sp.]|jgi:predicted transcriptional regulator|nr:helix-turn-helix domain-containing protein [Treponema sp.]
MTHKFSELEKKMSPESRKRVDQAVQEALKALPLTELRNARGLSQKMLAEALGIQQPAVAKMEKRADMYISTLRSHIEAMGGQLEITARFPEGAVKISNFSHLGTSEN